MSNELIYLSLYRAVQMMGGLFENFNEDTFVDEADQFDTLKETEISKVFNQTLENCRLSYIEVLSTSLKLNVCITNSYLKIKSNVNIYSKYLHVLIILFQNINKPQTAYV